MISQKIIDEWCKPRTIFALMHYEAYLIMISCGLATPILLEWIVKFLFIFYFSNKAIKALTTLKEKNV